MSFGIDGNTISSLSSKLEMRQTDSWSSDPQLAEIQTAEKSLVEVVFSVRRSLRRGTVNNGNV